MISMVPCVNPLLTITKPWFLWSVSYWGHGITRIQWLQLPTPVSRLDARNESDPSDAKWTGNRNYEATSSSAVEEEMGQSIQWADIMEVDDKWNTVQWKTMKHNTHLWYSCLSFVFCSGLLRFEYYNDSEPMVFQSQCAWREFLTHCDHGTSLERFPAEMLQVNGSRQESLAIDRVAVVLRLGNCSFKVAEMENRSSFANTTSAS